MANEIDMLKAADGQKGSSSDLEQDRMLTFTEFQAQARRTANTAHPLRERRLVGALGIAGEAGEVADLIKKFEGHGLAFEPDRLGEELGDLLWCIANVASLYGLELAKVAEDNIAKLARRYPHGFDPDRAAVTEPED